MCESLTLYLPECLNVAQLYLLLMCASENILFDIRVENIKPMPSESISHKRRGELKGAARAAPLRIVSAIMFALAWLRLRELDGGVI